jgi:hypothetical protein
MEEKSLKISQGLIISTILVGVLWIVFGWYAAWYQDCIQSTLLAHIMFLVIFMSGIVLSAVFYLKKWKYETEQAKHQTEFENKKTLEELRKDKYTVEATAKMTDEKEQAKIEKMLDALLEKKETTYRENLKTLKKNIDLYNEVKKILEGNPVITKEQVVQSPKQTNSKKS